MSSSEGCTPQDKPRGDNCLHFIDEQTETQNHDLSRLMQMGRRVPDRNSGPRPQSPGVTGSWIPPAQRRHLIREEIKTGCPSKGGLCGLKLFFPSPSRPVGVGGTWECLFHCSRPLSRQRAPILERWVHSHLWDRVFKKQLFTLGLEF